MIIYAAKYKTNTSKIDVNGKTYTLSKNSNDGAYDVITVDTSVQKTVTVKTLSGGYRVMIDKISFCTYEIVVPHECNTNVKIKGKDATCTQDGITDGAECSICGKVTLEQEIIEAYGHTTDNGVCDRCGVEFTPSLEPVLTITPDDFNGTSYAANNNTKKKNGYSYTSYQVMKQSGVMQWQKSAGYITFESISGMKKLEIASSAGTFTVTVGGKTVTGSTANGVTTYNLEGLSGQVKISVGSVLGKTSSITFYQ